MSRWCVRCIRAVHRRWTGRLVVTR